MHALYMCLRTCIHMTASYILYLYLYACYCSLLMANLYFISTLAVLSTVKRYWQNNPSVQPAVELLRFHALQSTQIFTGVFTSSITSNPLGYMSEPAASRRLMDGVETYVCRVDRSANQVKPATDKSVTVNSTCSILPTLRDTREPQSNLLTSKANSEATVGRVQHNSNIQPG